MKLYRLQSYQSLSISKDEAWEFLSNPSNLKVITPKHMDFQIISRDDRSIYPGQIIQYTVAPFMGYKTKWVTEITHVLDGQYFVDEQRFGPYALWHHKHFIKEIPGGVMMEDVIDYKLPFGILGQMVHSFIVEKQLLKIFKYREQKLRELFGEINRVQNKLILRSF